MKKKTTHRPMATLDRHRGWLQLVETDGPFLAAKALTKAWPHGMPHLESDRRSALRFAAADVEAAWDRWQSATDPDLDAYRAARDTFVDVVLRTVIGWGAHWQVGTAALERGVVSSPRGDVVTRPTGALQVDDRVAALVLVVDPVDSLRDPGLDGWSESPVVRMEFMLRAAKVPVGIVTDGRWWALVSVPEQGLASSGVVDAQTWVAEPAVSDALAEVLSLGSLLNAALPTYLPDVFVASQLAAEEITDALGVQVRKAVELLVAALDESAADAQARGEDDPLPDDGDAVYEAVVTVVMRLVFLLFAEERGLLPQTELYRRAYGIADQLDELTRREADADAEALDRTFLTWHRLLATSTALFAGVNFEDLRLPAYGGSLFDPSRFPFLGRLTDRGTLALAVSDRVMLHVLRSVQTTNIKGEGERRVSFRDMDVEQIGYIYEGLLGYTCRRAETTTLGLIGKDGAEPEMPLDVLDELLERAGAPDEVAHRIFTWVKQNQPAADPGPKGALVRALNRKDSEENAEQLLLSATDDIGLRNRLRAWIGIIRRDLRGRPVVIHENGWVVVETPSRKNAGAHYTPKALAEEVVLHALEPLVFSPGPYQTPDTDEWRPLSSTDLLELKVADIACGSGAFLVAAARYLADRVVEAWRREGRDVGHTPDALRTHALREVVAHCLYGADINGMAVEMCKLSLWLVSLDPAKPFSFVDDKVFHGNSLLGLTSVRQLEELHISPEPAPAHVQGRWEISGDQLSERLGVREKVEKAITLRRHLASEVNEHDPMRSAAAKAADKRRLDELTHELMTVADGVIAAGLALGGKPGKKLDEAYENLRIAVGRAYAETGGVSDPTMLDGIIAKGLTPTVETDYDRWEPLHWCLAAPDVMRHGGFDAIVGNPPFMGSKKISNAVGQNVRNWYVESVGHGVRGNADLVAYFLLRAVDLISASGTIGLICTNTIAQGDTREVGLERLPLLGLHLTRAIRSRPWPARNVDLQYAALWGGKSEIGHDVCRIVDGVPAHQISPQLEAAGGVSGPAHVLPENVGRCFVGLYPNGEGFVIDATDPLLSRLRETCSDVLYRYVIGDDINDAPGGYAGRWIVDFTGMDREVAEGFADAFVFLRERVKEYRQTLTNKPRQRERWWLFERSAITLRKIQRRQEQVLAMCLVSNTIMPLRMSSDYLFGHSAAVFADASFENQAVLSSSLHQIWSINRSSTLGAGVRYAHTDAFGTFPRPAETSALERIGRALDEERREIMLRRQLGLTKLYNLVNDPDLPDEGDRDAARMRAIHTELDHVVIDAYGWDDVELDHGFHTYRQMTRWTVSPAARVEILDRLLEENHRRAALQGQAPPAEDDDEIMDEDEQS